MQSLHQRVTKMKLSEIKPFIRFAEKVQYKMEGNPVEVTDARLFFVLEGAAELLSEGKKHALQKSTLAYCPAGAKYTLSSPEGTTMLVLNFDLTEDHSFQSRPISPHPVSEGRAEVFRTNVEDSNLLNRVFILADAANAYAPISEICREFGLQAPYSLGISASLLKTLLLRLHRNEGPSHDAIKITKEYILTNYMNAVTNADIAAISGYHEYYLNRIFKKETGQSIHQFLLEVRLNAIREKLRNTDMPLSEIADTSGFKSYPHMSVFFKERFGMTPKEYRKEFKNNL